MFAVLTLVMWVGFLGVHCEVGGGKVAPTHPCLKPVRIMLKASNLARKYTPIFSFRKYFFAKFFVKIFDIVLLLLLSLVTGPSCMSISSLVLEFWQFSFIRDWPEIRKSEIPPSDFAQYLETGASYGYQMWHEYL